MMLAVVVVLSFCSVVGSELRPCAADDICRPVPAELCDLKRCVAVNGQEKNAMTSGGLKVYTWNVVQKALCSHCPMNFSSVFSKYDDKTTSTVTFTVKSGKNCRATQLNTYTREAVIDECTGDVIYEMRDYDGVKSHECFIYFNPGVAAAFIKCVDGPAKNGERCAGIIVSEVASGNCNRTKLNAFVESLNVDFKQEFVDCI